MDDKKSKRIVWTPKTVKIDSIEMFENNPRIITESGLKQLEESFDEVGMFQPLAINTSNKLLSGHARLMQLKKDGYKEITVMVPDRKLTPKQEKALVIRANKNVAGQWDFDVLANEFEFEDLIEWGFSAEELGVPEIEKIDPQCDEDEVPEVKDTITKRGDIWLLGNHRVMCGDSTMIDDVEKLMNGDKADMVHTDPPYNIAYEGGSKKRSKIENDDMGDDFPVFLEKFYTTAFIVTKDGGAIYVWHASTETHRFIQKFLDAGFLFKSYIVWNKNNSTFGRSDYHWKHEPCIYGWKSGGSHKWCGDRKQTTVWDMTRPSRSEEHPTMKPVELCEIAIINSSDQSDIVMDLFLGSGSTLIACEKNNRKCYGMELGEHYCDVIVNRWQKYTGKKATLEATGQTYDELLEARNA